MNENEKERIVRKLKRKRREMKEMGVDQDKIRRVRRAIRKLRDEKS